MGASRPSISTLISFLPLASAINIVLSNDDGWAEKNIRVLYDALTSAGEDVVISAPADNKSGSSSLDLPPTVVLTGCEFDSCPPGSPAYGFNSSMPQFNYVNSYPVTAMKYGLSNLSQSYFGGEADLAVAGFNVGSKCQPARLVSPPPTTAALVLRRDEFVIREKEASCIYTTHLSQL